MKVVTLTVFALGWPACVANPLRPDAQRHTLLQLQREAWEKPTLFSGPKDGAELNLQGFCKRPDNKPACEEKPCCCWSTWAAPVSPDYDSGESKSKQLCLNPPDGFVYAPEPGGSFDDGYFDTLKNQGLPTYDGRRLCCVRRADGVQVDSQQDLSQAVKPIPTTTTTGVLGVAADGSSETAGDGSSESAVDESSETAGVAGEAGVTVPAQFTTETFTTSLLAPGDEYETAQMEEAAQAHLTAANDLTEAASALSTSATAINAVNMKLQTDPNLLRSRKHVAEMRAAIDSWAKQRWHNLNILKAGDASAFGS